MATQITANLPTLNFPREVDYPTQEDWAAFSAAAELNFGILGSGWSTQMQLWKTQANVMSIELNNNADLAQSIANYQGDWTSKGYTLGQTVSVNGVYYICKLTHATGQNPTTGGSLYWNIALGNWNLKVNNYGNETIAGIKTFSSSPIVPTPTTDFQVATKQYVDEVRIGLIDYGYVAKAYHIVAFGGEFNRADYPKLWAYLQANSGLVATEAGWQAESAARGGICGYFSSGNGTTTFRVPNLDKAFLRPDSRGVGSYQGDAIRNITGAFGSFYLSTKTDASGAFLYSPYSNTPAKIGVDGVDPGSNTNIMFNASLAVPTAEENRPKNIAVLPLIVAK